MVNLSWIELVWLSHWTVYCVKILIGNGLKLSNTSRMFWYLSLLLPHYNPCLPLRLSADASAYHLGAVISHVMVDGKEQPIAFASLLSIELVLVKISRSNKIEGKFWRKRSSLIFVSTFIVKSAAISWPGVISII